MGVSAEKKRLFNFWWLVYPAPGVTGGITAYSA